MKPLFRVGYNARTHRVKGWEADHIEDCDVVALFLPGLSIGRMAGSLRKLADAIEEYPDPNKAEQALPVVEYTANAAYAANETVVPLPKHNRNKAALG